MEFSVSITLGTSGGEVGQAHSRDIVEINMQWLRLVAGATVFVPDMLSGTSCFSGGAVCAAGLIGRVFVLKIKMLKCYLNVI